MAQFLFTLCFLFLLTPLSWAENSFTYAPNAALDPIEKDETGSIQYPPKRVEKAKKVVQGPIPILGRCTLLVSAGNPMPAPCANSILILMDKTGKELFKTRTNAAGEFEFLGDRAGEYHLASGSHYYEIVSVKNPIHGGDQVDLKMQLK